MNLGPLRLLKPVTTPFLATALGITVGQFAFKASSMSTDTAVLGLVSQFSGTATAVVAAIIMLPRVSSADPQAEGMRLRRMAQLRLAFLVSMVTLVLSTMAITYDQVGPWALSAVTATIAFLAWALFTDN